MSAFLVSVVALLVAWSWVCVTAGRLYEVRRRLQEMAEAEAADLDARDAWATAMEERKGVA